MPDDLDSLPRPAPVPCGSCPYRRDVPSGVWTEDEYEKLLRYDGETWEQMLKGGMALFDCHQQDGHLCAGWLACHDTDHLLALRFNPVHPSAYDYESPVPVFSSGQEAHDHGVRDIDDPSDEAIKMIETLKRKRALRERSRAAKQKGS